MKKIALVVLVVAGLLTAATVSSQSSWVGTDSMQIGSIIRSAPLKANLDYLFNFKVEKPMNCNLTNQRLAWSGTGWLCETFVPVGDVPRQSCLFNGTSIQDGDSVAAFQTSSVPFGQSCTSEVRTCNDGSLSGSYSFSTCQPADPGACTFNSTTVQSGDSVVAFETSSVPFGDACQRETRTCSNGSLSGSYQFSSCADGEPATCQLNGEVIQHGASVTAYQESSVSAPGVCRPETRTCSNGSLSGSYQNTNCEVVAATCSSQNLTFNYTIPQVVHFGGGAITNFTQSTSESCTVSNSLVSNSETGDVLRFTDAQCIGDNSDLVDASHSARCGLSGWELSTETTPVILQCTDAGTVVERRDLAFSALRLQADDRCDCGFSLTGGQYGRNVVCGNTDGSGSVLSN